MSLSDAEAELLRTAGSSPNPIRRQQAVGIALSKHGADEVLARELLTESYLAETRPSFHLIPKGDAMASEAEFDLAYQSLDSATDSFRVVNAETLSAALLADPAALAPLRMILGLTHNELAVAVRLVNSESKVTGNAVKNFERRPAPEGARPARLALVRALVDTALAVMNREVLAIPDPAAEFFHSKLDKRDSVDGWDSTRRDAMGVPYTALLYQRYVGGVWRQVQDAYSEIKGDAVLEFPLRDLLEAHLVPHHHTRSGAAGAAETAERYGLSPGPDFVIPDDTPSLVLESKVAEDGGTARDKAARIKNMCTAAIARGLKPCALVDGKGWSERPTALLDVVIATQGRTYSLATLYHVLELPEVAELASEEH